MLKDSKDSTLFWKTHLLKPIHRAGMCDWVKTISSLALGKDRKDWNTVARYLQQTQKQPLRVYRWAKGGLRFPKMSAVFGLPSNTWHKVPTICTPDYSPTSSSEAPALSDTCETYLRFKKISTMYLKKVPKCLENLFFFHGKFHRSLLIRLSESLCPELKQNKHEWGCRMRACTASVLTARPGRLYAQLLGNVAPRWVAEEAGVRRSVAAGVEVKPQHADSGPGLVRVPLGSSVLVHCGARVSQSFHGCHRGHRCNAAFKSIKSEWLGNMFYGSWTKLSVMHHLPLKEPFMQLLHKLLSDSNIT